MQAAKADPYKRIDAPIRLSAGGHVADFHQRTSPKIEVFYHSPEEEIAYGQLFDAIQAQIQINLQYCRFGPACWLWDYLRRSKSGGFFLPLSGGIDSCATALITFSMCQLVCEAIKAGSKRDQILKQQ